MTLKPDFTVGCDIERTSGGVREEDLLFRDEPAHILDLRVILPGHFWAHPGLQGAAGEALGMPH